MWKAEENLIVKNDLNEKSAAHADHKEKSKKKIYKK